MKSELKDLKVSLFGITNIQNAPKGFSCFLSSGMQSSF